MQMSIMFIHNARSTLLTQEIMDELTNSSISIGVAVAVPAIVCVVIVIGRTGEIGKCRYV